MSILNSKLFEACRAFSPNFKNLTSAVTAQMLDNNGFEAINSIDNSIVNNWFNLSLKIVLQKVDVARARNPLEDSGIVEYYDTPYGGYAQRLAVQSLKPTSPKFKELVDGSSVDMQKVRLPKVTERFFKLNWAFQNYYTLQDFQVKQIFQSPYGMSEFIGGIVSQMQASYKKQKYVNALETLSAGINSTSHALKSTQKIELSSWTDAGVQAAELQEFIKALKNLKVQLEATPSTSAFNAAGFETAVDADNMVCMMRAGIQTDIQTALTTGSLYGFDKQFLDMPFKVQEVVNFGGLVPVKSVDETKTGDGTTTAFELEKDGYRITKVTVGGVASTAWTFDKENNEITFTEAPANDAAIVITYDAMLYPLYSTTTGEQIGWVYNEDTTTADVQDGAESYIDTNEDILAVVIQKGTIFETIQNPVQVIPAPYNAAGLYQTFWFSQADNGISYDYYYNVIVITKPQS